MRHMELISHFILHTGPSLDEGKMPSREYHHILMSAATSAPYLMYQTLALSALHLGYSTTNRSEYHREEATALQTQALSLFNESLAEITSVNCVPILIFTNFLGLHALAEAVPASELDADSVLDRFVTYLNLHRGVHTITERAWKFLMESNVSSILRRAERSLDLAPSQSQERANVIADHLYDLLNDTDMSKDADQACRDAVSHLQLTYQSEPTTEKSPEGEQQPAGLVWAWPILLSSKFTDLLMKRRPEALIILCYYAVLLHWRRNMWIMGNVGHMLIEAITKFLGTYWRRWLDLAIHMLEKPR
jgi:hypothetical protein